MNGGVDGPAGPVKVMHLISYGYGEDPVLSVEACNSAEAWVGFQEAHMVADPDVNSISRVGADNVLISNTSNGVVQWAQEISAEDWHEASSHLEPYNDIFTSDITDYPQ